MIDHSLILDFKVGRPEKHQKSETVLIPVWVYGIVAPIKRKNQLNFIEIAILSLCQLNRSEKKIAEMLDLHYELLKTILSKFRGQRYIDQKHSITEEGKACLKSGELDQIELTTGFIFQNAISGELHSYYTENLPYSDRASGTKLKVLKGEQSWDASDIQKFVNKLVKKEKKRGEKESSVDINFSLTREVDTPWKVEKAQLMYLRAYIYMPDDAQGSDFRVTEPFFGTDNLRLKSLLWDQRTETPFKRLFETLLGESSSEIEQRHAYHTQLEKHALLLLEGTFGHKVNESPLLQEMLVVWVKRLEIKNQRDYGWKVSKVQDLCLGIRTLIEGAIKDARKQFLTRAWLRVQVGEIKHITKPIIEKLTGGWGKGLGRFYNVKVAKHFERNSLWSEAESIGNGKKNDAIVALLIEADTQGNSFIHEAFKTHPDLLERFDQIFTATDANSHHQNNQSDNPLKGFDDLEELYINCEIALSALLRLERNDGETDGKE